MRNNTSSKREKGKLDEYNRQKNVKGEVDRYKEKLVAKSHEQKQGIDYVNKKSFIAMYKKNPNFHD